MVRDLRQKPDDFEDLDPEELAMLESKPDPLGTCTYCGNEYPIGEIEYDHVIPRSRGGRDIRANQVACCPSCNSKKGNQLPGEWLIKLFGSAGKDPNAKKIIPNLASLLDALLVERMVAKKRRQSPLPLHPSLVREYADLIKH